MRKGIGRIDIDFRKVVPDYFLLTVGSIILAINFNIFLAPNKIAPGGVSGAAIIIHHFTGWLPGWCLGGRWCCMPL